MISGSQCRAARALVELARAKLSLRSGVFEDTIHDFERKVDNPNERDFEALQAALEELGAVFIPENGGGIGVRLKFTPAEARQIARLEGEAALLQMIECHEPAGLPTAMRTIKGLDARDRAHSARYRSDSAT